MENTTVSGLRSRSRSKTPFLRSSCDRETCAETGDHVHKSGRKTPIKRSTPIKQLSQQSNKAATEAIVEEDEHVSPLAHRTRQSTSSAKKTVTMVKTSDYSSEESLDRLSRRKETLQNELNSQYERVSTTRRVGSLADVTLSPIGHASQHVSDRWSRLGSPAYSACSTDSSFAEQALADTSALLEQDPSPEHLPSRLYKSTQEYWNKYPKTDYTYSYLSRDRVELAPGQVAMPNMSRRSLQQFRLHGSHYSTDELDKFAMEDSWSPTYYRPTARQQSRARSAYHAASAAVSGALAALYYYIVTTITTVVTTVTEVTETVIDKVTPTVSYSREKSRRWWPWLLLLLLLPALGYGSHYTYQNLDRIALPNFTDFYIDLQEFTAVELPSISLPSLPNISLPEIPKLNLTFPQINITLPDISDNLPEVSITYKEYKDIVQNRMSDASDYMKVVAESCFEELRRFWHGVIG